MKLSVRIALALLVLAAAAAATAAVICAPGQQCVYLPDVAGRAQPASSPAPLPSATPRPQPQAIVGLAVLGDSTQDEYRADNPRGGEYGATTLGWVELLAGTRGVNLGEWGSRPEPRRNGFAFNWARSGATSDQMISAGQHTGAAQQVLAGQVSHAVIQIGINDFFFSGLGLEIYEGKVAGGALRDRLDRIADNIITAARTLKETGRCAVLVASTQDYMTLPVVPELYATYQDPEGRARFVEAVAYLNRRLEQLSAQAGVSYFDFNAALLAEVQARRDDAGFLVVGGERIDLRTRGNGPRFGLLDDGYIHPGTVLSGLYANVFIEAFNRSFGTAIAPLSDDEILRAAGVKP